MLQIRHISVSHEGGSVLHDISLSIDFGSIHAIMGPNGSGKSSLAHALIGYPGYEITNGEIVLDKKDITQLSVEKRAQAGLFLAFQYPCALPGVSVMTFLTESYRALGNEIVSMDDFYKKIIQYTQLLAINSQLLDRDLNDGFSGGEKKKFELLQLLVLKPKVAILDEIDSGLDVDALKIVANALLLAQQENPKMALIIITHYQRILSYITPEHVHIVSNGTISDSGDYSLAQTIDQRGYDGYRTHI